MTDDRRSAHRAATGRRTRRRRQWVVLVLSVLLTVLSAGTLTALLLTAPQSADAVVLTDLDGTLVDPDPGSVPSEEELGRMDLVDDTGDRFQAPSVGLDVPLGAMSEVGGMIRPPGFQSAYLIRNRGVALADAAEGTVYVALHSVQDGRAPGNYLIDTARARATVAAGDEILVGEHTYRVEETRSVAKTALPTEADLWVDVPGRLVVVTCLQRAEGRSVDNVVIVARLVA